jgi:hypothetical protein
MKHTTPETHATVVQWFEDTFGHEPDERVAVRVQEVMVKLAKAVASQKPDDHVRRSAADVAIALYHWVARMNGNLDRRAQAAMVMGMAKELVPETDSISRAVLRAETKLLIAKNMIADDMPRTRVMQEVTAVRVILEELVMRLGGNLTEEVDAQMAIARSHRHDVASPAIHVAQCVPSIAADLTI